MPRILITGINGVTGWHLFQRAGEKGYDVYGTFRKKHSVLDHERLLRIDLDSMSEIEKLMRDIRPDYIFHARAICDLDLCEIHPEMATRINVDCTRMLLKSAAQIENLKKFVYLSTDHVFGGKKGLYREEDIPDPIHVYGRTKVEAENLVSQSGLPFLIIRPGLVIGESFQGNKGPRDFLFSRIKAGKPTHLFTDELRTPIRAEKLVERVFSIAFSGEQGIFHIAEEKSYNRFELGRQLAKESRLPTHNIFPRLRGEDKWAHIRPSNLCLQTERVLNG